MGKKKVKKPISDDEEDITEEDFLNVMDCLSPRQFEQMSRSLGYTVRDYDDHSDDDDDLSDADSYFSDEYYVSPPELETLLVKRDHLSEKLLPPEKNIKKRILDLLEQTCYGDYMTGGKLDSNYLMPAIEILIAENGKYKPLPLPIVYAEQVNELKRNCSCFVKNENVNSTKSWHLDPHKFRITNPKWESSVEELVGKVKAELGILSEKKIDFSLSKMILHEVGGIFDFSTDIDKEDGIVANLLIQLPSSFTGGNFTLSHSGKEKQFQYKEESSYSPYYVGCYSDCTHKGEPLTSGYRLSLVYNLKYSGTDRIAPYDGATQLKDMQKIIETWIKAPMYTKLCYILENKYPKTAFGTNTLQGKDKIVYQLFSQLEHITVNLATLEKREETICVSDIENNTDITYKAHTTNNERIDFIVEDEVFPEEARRRMELTHKDIDDEEDFMEVRITRCYKSPCILIYPKQFKSLCKQEDSSLDVFLKDYKEKKTDKKKHLLMAYTSSLLCCSEANLSTIRFVDMSKFADVCLLLNYLPLSMKYVEKVLIVDEFKTMEATTFLTKVIKHHGTEHFKELVGNSLEKLFIKPHIYSNQVISIGNMILELNEQSWITSFVNKVVSLSSNISNTQWTTPDAIMVIFKLKEHYPSYSEKFNQFFDAFVKSESSIDPSRRNSSQINAEVIIKLNIINLAPPLLDRLSGSMTGMELNEVLSVMKHFGIEKIEPLLVAALKNRFSFIPRKVAIQQLSSRDSAEAKYLSNKIFDSIIQNCDFKLEIVSEYVDLLTFFRKNHGSADEIRFSNALIQKVSTPRSAFSLVQEIIKTNGTECFRTGTGLRMILEHSYKVLYNSVATPNASQSLDLDLEGTSSWIFNHITISCSCEHCGKVKKFLISNEKEFSLKEKQAARKHVETILKNQVDLIKETIKVGSPQTLKLTKTRMSLESKKTITTSVENILKQYIEYATQSDQKPLARPPDESNVANEPPTKKVKQE